MSSTNDLQRHVDRLEDALTVWASRDETRPQAGVRQAANIAVESIDALLRELYALRNGLLTEVRQADDVANARVDAMLARRRAEGGAR